VFAGILKRIAAPMVPMLYMTAMIVGLIVIAGGTGICIALRRRPDESPVRADDPWNWCL
jgi:hypothetical protein